MSNQPKLQKYPTIKALVDRFRDDFNSQDFILIYAFNGTGKTRLSMEFKEKGRKGGEDRKDTLYFNSFTEDLFNWDNDLKNDKSRVLKLNSDSKFFSGFKELAIEERIESHLDRYSDFSFDIDYEKWEVSFSREILKKVWENGKLIEKLETEYNIKISRGEENIFIWSVFLAICELSIEGDNSYKWVEYFYIDDPISSLDENNAIAIASDLAQLLKRGNEKSKIKTVISSHHSLFFNVMCNELKNHKLFRYFLHKNGTEGYTLQKTDDTPFFHHVALLNELKILSDSGKINTYHFNILRNILEKTSSFFGFNDFSACIQGIEDEVLFARALNLLSHGKYSVYDPVEMNQDNKELFIRILNSFLDKYKFHLPVLLAEKSKDIEVRTLEADVTNLENTKNEINKVDATATQTKRRESEEGEAKGEKIS
ncbi:MAG: anticodon nuclease [Bacteroidota bacterium]